MDICGAKELPIWNSYFMPWDIFLLIIILMITVFIKRLVPTSPDSNQNKSNVLIMHTIINLL